MSILPIILAGGYGSRLWPLSREDSPKQFINLNGNQSLLQNTLRRLDNFKAKLPIIICNEEHRFIVAEQLREIQCLAGNIILEPTSKNTAPAIAIAALTALAKNEDPLLLVLAADHAIQNPTAFQEAIRTAIPHAETGKLVTFGAPPTKPETGYGYIRKGKSLSTYVYTVEEFTEKPDPDTAANYLTDTNYYWNTGIFLFKASRYLEELEIHRPDILTACQLATENTKTDLDFLRIDTKAFLQCPADSIDYAIMEKTHNAVMVSMNAGWSDIGSWPSLWEIATDKDNEGNVSHGDVMLLNCRNNYIHADTELIATIGLENLIVIQTKDAILIAHKDSAQDVKLIVEKLKYENRKEYKQHREVYRPWGKYDLIDQGTGYQVKRITVNPGAKISTQKHFHRAEHWIVVSGTARITNGESTSILNANQSTYIPIGIVHSLENIGETTLELIEVQSGNYLGEDDIVRFEKN
jgi:mannose-1-phosphate guanylyltransferase